MLARVSLDAISRRLGVDLVREQVQLYDAGAIATAAGRAPWHRDLVSADPARAALITGVTPDNGQTVSSFVVDVWDSDAVMRLLDLAVETEPPIETTLGELSGAIRTVPADTEFALWVAAGDPYRSLRSASTLSRIMARLRAPGGCPWDREQTTISQRQGVLNEAYEIVDAIDAGDDRNLAEELGDVLMAITLQAQIAADDERFTLADAYAAVNAKMLRRHPHVFGDVAVNGTDDIVANWARIKAEEKVAAGVSIPDSTDPIGRFPEAMPALSIARELHHRGSLAGPFGNDPDVIATNIVAWYLGRVEAGGDPDRELRAGLRTLLDH